MEETSTFTERVRALIEHEPSGDGRVRNHLSVTGPPDEVRAFIADCRTDGGARVLSLGGTTMPIRWERHARRSAEGQWLRIEPGREPEGGAAHTETAKAEFAFGSDEPLDDALAETSRRHPGLEFRYAGLRHHRLREDVAKGGLWQGGERIAKASEPAIAHQEEGAQMATLVQHVEALEPPRAA